MQVCKFNPHLCKLYYPLVSLWRRWQWRWWGSVTLVDPNSVSLSFPDQLPKSHIDSGAVDLTKHGKVFDKVSCKFIASKHFLLVNTTQLRKIRYVTKITISLLFLSLCRCQNWKRNMGTWNKSMWPLVNPAKKASVGI